MTSSEVLMDKEISVLEASDNIKTFIPEYHDIDIKLIRRRVSSYLTRNAKSDKPLYMKIKMGVYERAKNIT